MAKKPVQLDEKGYRKFGIRDSLAYAAGDFGCNMTFALKSTIMPMFWTQFMLIGEYWYSLLLVIIQVWDAINDPLIGSLVDADRHTYKHNKFLAYIFAGSIGLIVGGASCFIPIPNAPHFIKCAVFVLGYVIWDACYTVANVPYGSLLSLISDKPADRASLSAWRSVGSMVGNMLPMVLLPMLCYDANDNLVGGNVFIAALVLGVIGFAAFQFMIRNTVVRVDTNVKSSEEQPRFNVIKAMGNFLKNRPAVGATVAAMGMFLGMQGGTAAVTVLFQSYFKNVQISGVVQMFSMIPIVAFTPLARKMVMKYGKKELSVVGSIVSVVACVAMLVLPIPANNTGIVVYVVCQLVNSLGIGIYSTVSWSMMGDAIDYNEWRTGNREEGVAYSLHSFFRKLAQGLGPALVIVIMTACFGYVGANEGNQTAEVAQNMRYLVPALYLFSAALQFVGLGLIYNLDKKTLDKMNTELAARKAQ